MNQQTEKKVTLFPYILTFIVPVNKAKYTKSLFLSPLLVDVSIKVLFSDAITLRFFLPFILFKCQELEIGKTDRIIHWIKQEVKM